MIINPNRILNSVFQRLCPSNPFKFWIQNSILSILADSKICYGLSVCGSSKSGGIYHDDVAVDEGEEIFIVCCWRRGG